MKTFKTSFTLLLCFIVPQLFAQKDSTAIAELKSMSIAELINVKVFSSGFFEMKEEKAIGNIKVFNRQLIDRYQIQSLSELLDIYVDGIDISKHERTGDLITVRGVGVDNNAKTLVLYNGAAINRRIHFGYTGFESPLTGDIQRVESILGPGAILWGSGAINNFVNIITPTGIDRENLWTSASFGANGLQWTSETSYGYVINRDKKMSLFVYAGMADNQGQRFQKEESAENWNRTYGSKLTSKDLDNMFINELDKPNIKASLRFSKLNKSDFFNFDFNSRFQYMSKVNPAKGYNTFLIPGKNEVDTFFYTEQEAHEANLINTYNDPEGATGYIAMVNKDLLIQLKTSFNFNKKTSLDITPYFSGFTSILEPTQRLTDLVKENDLDVKNEIDIKKGNSEIHTGGDIVFRTERFKNHKIALGVGYSYKEFGNKGLSIFGNNEYNDKFEVAYMHWNEMSIYGENVFSLNNFTASLGFRYDFVAFSDYRATKDDEGFPINNFKNLSPRIAMSYKINKKNNLKFSYQKGYRYPDAAYYHWLLYWQNVYGPHLSTEEAPAFSGNLEYEEMHSIELNYRYSVIQKEKQKVDINVRAFGNHYKNTLGWVNWVKIYPEATKSLQEAGIWEGWWGSFGNSTKDFYALGGEISVNAINIINRINAYLGYTLSMPLAYNEEQLKIATKDSRNWTRGSTHSVIGRADVKIIDKLSANTSFKWRNGIQFDKIEYADDYENETFANAAELMSRSRFILNLGITYEPMDFLTVSITGKNLTVNFADHSIPFIHAGPSKLSTGAFIPEYPQFLLRATAKF